MKQNLEQKKQFVEEVSSNLKSKGEVNAFVVNYSTLSSSQMNELKKEMVKVDSKLTVVKNTLIHRIFDSLGIKVDHTLEGQNALLIAGKDMIAPIKSIFEFIKKNSKGKIVMGILNGRFIDGSQVETLSRLPSRDELIGRVLGGFTSPIRGFVYTLNGVQSNFVRALNAIKEKKSA